MTLRILLVTDDDQRLAPLSTALRGAGYEVRVVAPDQEGPGEREADLVLVDPSVAPGPLDVAERRHIAATLRRTRGNKRQAAHLLGIARSTLLAKVRKYGLDGVGHEAGEPVGGLAS